MTPRTSRAALREAVESGALKAWMRDEKIQSRRDGEAEWAEWEDRTGGNNPAFGNPDLFWRPAPEKKRVPFTSDTIPVDGWWRRKNDKYTNCRVFSIHSNGVLFPGQAGYMTAFSVLMDEWEWSDDRKHWKPCSLEVES